MTDYRQLAGELAEDIRLGRLKPGDRLPPQREFAFRRGVAVSTASRVYAQLRRQGLVTGEVGRGTFVRSATPPLAGALLEPPGAPVNLETNFPILESQPAAFRALLGRMMESKYLEQSLLQTGAAGTGRARLVAAHYLARGEFEPRPERILFTGSGRQAIAAVFSALAGPGEAIGVEAVTYAVVKGIAARLGITLLPIAMDDRGLCPEALLQANRSSPLRAVYFQSSVHNPLGCTMDRERRRDIAGALQAADLIGVEDGIYSFLVDDPPVACVCPERIVYLDSLSKRGAPGLTLGFVLAPLALVERIAASIRSGAWGAGGFALEAGLCSMGSAAARELVDDKRRDACARQDIARLALAGHRFRGDERSFHLWLELPETWRSELFAAAAARRGIALTVGSAFAVASGHAPNAVRLALASPPLDVLETALSSLADLVGTGPEFDAPD